MAVYQVETLCVTDRSHPSQPMEGGLQKTSYGSLKRKAPLSTRSSASTRTFFDSADYMMAKEEIVSHSTAKKVTAAGTSPVAAAPAAAAAAAATTVPVCMQAATIADWRSLVEVQHARSDGSSSHNNSNSAGSSPATQRGLGLTGRDTQHNSMASASPSVTTSSPGSQPLYRGLRRTPSRLGKSSCCNFAGDDLLP